MDWGRMRSTRGGGAILRRSAAGVGSGDCACRSERCWRDGGGGSRGGAEADGGFWPGPLTLLLPRTAAVPDAVTAGRPLVGVRMPAHPVALELIRRAGVPVAAPSANLFGHISPTTAAHVLDDLDGRIDAVLDAGPTQHGVESTVLDPPEPMVIYRPGAVTAEQIRAVAGRWRCIEARKRCTRRRGSAAVAGGGDSPLRAAGAAGAAGCAAGRTRAAAGRDRARNHWRAGGRDAAGGVTLRRAAERRFTWGRWAAPEELAHGSMRDCVRSMPRDAR